MDWKQKKIGVLYGGLSEEREVSLRSGQALFVALQSLGYQVVAIDVDRHITKVLEREGIEVAVLALHGPMGEDGTIQGLLEFMGIPYTGPNVAASAICMDKGLSKRLFHSEGLPTPAWIELAGDHEEADELVDHFLGDFHGAAFVKPLDSGSSVGISRAVGKDELIRGVAKALSVSHRCMVERAIEGRELTLSILDGEAFPLIEIVPIDGFYDYDHKYTAGRTNYLVPAPNLDDKSLEAVVKIGLAAYHITGCRGLVRADFILDGEGTPWLLELNTIPGMTELSLAPKAAHAVGIEMPQLAERILQGARLK
ncbi:D-alanine--D-alanine ligase [Magnetococcus marinus MC-1]|uniref:D-alanine--D-alanine ligase n=1 Tax=Magnetococcus marinus (strain ATCC BAA-1437 / JCM 17883 / MC-1) TaxID=156889 RepID=DDL_MAGMM|nr:D-alanine--D-alanine ligase [Magnetococcus marinus]A0L5M8.1 RecName: Full=D-alanine--D-alanine ligase; AltName: Full=D-Ala-D-Ala ligase; AltName: Full=D-alanylalanine synthetase [Magnetococcus marinus MC-1]ABK43271.1 D-alanine--D-alanine ligase [Magnetococcus marinus MC-1]